MSARGPKSAAALLIDHLKGLPRPTEFDIAILDDSQSYPERSFAKVENHLGLHAPDLPRLAREFREEYASLRRRRCRCRPRRADDDAMGQPDDEGGGVGGDGGIDVDEDGSASTSTVLDATTCLLLVCPDHSTAWADRRRALLLPKDDDAATKERALREELDFCDLLFTRHSKAPSSWSHRKWVGRRLLDILSESILDVDVDGEDATNKIYQWAIAEIRTCSNVAERYPKNYHAWTHRRWACRSLLGFFGESTLSSLPSDRPSSLMRVVFRLLEDELSTTQRWMRTHVTDHSAVHYRGQVLLMLLEFGTRPALESMPRDDAKIGMNDGTGNGASIWAWNLLSESMEVSRTSCFAEYEVTWIHRRMCGMACIDYLSANGPMSDDDPRLIEFVKVEVTDLAATYLTDDRCRKSKLHALSYIVWIVRHLKRSELWRMCPANELTNLAAEVTDALACDDAIVGNAWRIRNNR